MVLDLLDPLSLGKYIQQMFSRGWLQGVLSSRHSFPLLSKPTGFAGTPATLSLVVRNLWIQEWPPAATVQCNWSFSDLWLAAWGGTPQKAKAQLKIEVESVHLNISSSRKRPQSFIGRLKLTSTLCQFFGWGFFFFWFFISCTTLAHSTPKTTFSHSNCQGKTWGGKIRVTSSLRARLYRKKITGQLPAWAS